MVLTAVTPVGITHEPLVVSMTWQMVPPATAVEPVGQVDVAFAGAIATALRPSTAATTEATASPRFFIFIAFS